jgi:hypothetical protein
MAAAGGICPAALIVQKPSLTGRGGLDRIIASGPPSIHDRE